VCVVTYLKTEKSERKEEQCERKCVKICLGLNQNDTGVWKSLVQLIC